MAVDYAEDIIARRYRVTALIGTSPYDDRGKTGRTAA